jgi:uncharacterized membrane protein
MWGSAALLWIVALVLNIIKTINGEGELVSYFTFVPMFTLSLGTFIKEIKRIKGGENDISGDERTRAIMGESAVWTMIAILFMTLIAVIVLFLLDLELATTILVGAVCGIMFIFMIINFILSRKM